MLLQKQYSVCVYVPPLLCGSLPLCVCVHLSHVLAVYLYLYLYLCLYMSTSMPYTSLSNLHARLPTGLPTCRHAETQRLHS